LGMMLLIVLNEVTSHYQRNVSSASGFDENRPRDFHKPAKIEG